MAKLSIGDEVEILSGVLEGKPATIWEIAGDRVGVKYKFFGSCLEKPDWYPASELKRLGVGGPCPVPPAQMTAVESPRQYCCEIMEDQLERESEDERYVRYLPQTDEIGLINRKDPDYYSPISYCPWCGKKIAPDASDSEA